MVGARVIHLSIPLHPVATCAKPRHGSASHSPPLVFDLQNRALSPAQADTLPVLMTTPTAGPSCPPSSQPVSGPAAPGEAPLVMTKPVLSNPVDPTADAKADAATDGLRFPRALVAAGQWGLDPALTFLNHGSYGSVPKAAMKAQAALRERVERDPVRFYKSDLEGLLDSMRADVGAFLGCRGADLAPCANATYALCHILYALGLKAGDEVLITDHEYQSLANELERVCAATGAKVVQAKIPFPISGPQQVTDAFLGAVTKKTRIAFISHITSGSSLVFPVAGIVKEFNRLGIDIVVDGAHSPGQIPVDIAALNPTYFVGSGHKWLSAPKGTGFVYVRPDKQASFRPVCLSSRANKVRPERALFLRDFDYQGTDDYSATLTLPHSIAALGGMLEGGWPALMRANHNLAMAGRAVVCDILSGLGVTAPAPESMIGTMATLLIPEPAPQFANRPTKYDDALQDALYENHRIVVPIWRLNDDRRVVRLSAQLYNSLEQYEKLGHALAEELTREQAWRATA